MNIEHEPNPGSVIGPECLETLEPCTDGSCYLLQAGLLPPEEVAQRCGILALARKESLTNYEATHDEMTGLLNRNGLFKTVATLQHGPYIAIYADGTATKEINDSLGHAVGDTAIIGIADILRTVDRTAILAREGGDEFWMVLKPETSGHSPQDSMQGLIQKLKDETTRFTEANPLLASQGFNLAVGGTIWMVGAEDLWTAKRRAEAFMYTHKASQGGDIEERRRKTDQP